ncbi:dihydroneopterin aldolase [Nibricoccus sp. IMCC34717]|uniref:dihydroneopterin aldolase n=1 Tax=Nibricoccus sp. IMCC34717 TaxID=3034021 RepID=UPI00384CBD58
MNGKIHLNGMVFYGRHGHHPEENALGQRFVVDLTLELDIAEAAARDELGATVNYAAVYSLCRDIVEGSPVRLLETLTDRVLKAVLERHPRVAAVHIEVRKPSVPIAGALEYVAVEASRHRA